MACRTALAKPYISKKAMYTFSGARTAGAATCVIMALKHVESAGDGTRMAGPRGLPPSEAPLRKDSKDAIRDNFTEMGNLRVHYIESGGQASKPPLILIHGGGAASAEEAWGSNIVALSEGRRAIAMDLPGYGQSGDPQGVPSARYYIDFVRSFMEKLGIEKADIVGHSMGGCIAIGLALEAPCSVNKLVAVDPYGLYGRPVSLLGYAMKLLPDDMARLVRSLVGYKKREPNYKYEDRLKNSAPQPSGLLWRIENYMATHEVRKAFIGFIESELIVRLRGGRLDVECKTDYMDRISMLGTDAIKTLFMHGEQDPIFPGRQLERAAAKVKGSQYYVFRNTGHEPQSEHPGIFNERVSGFLDS